MPAPHQTTQQWLLPHGRFRLLCLAPVGQESERDSGQQAGQQAVPLQSRKEWRTAIRLTQVDSRLTNWGLTGELQALAVLWPAGLEEPCSTGRTRCIYRS